MKIELPVGIGDKIYTIHFVSTLNDITPQARIVCFTVDEITINKYDYFLHCTEAEGEKKLHHVARGNEYGKKWAISEDDAQAIVQKNRYPMEYV